LFSSNKLFSRLDTSMRLYLGILVIICVFQSINSTSSLCKLPNFCRPTPSPLLYCNTIPGPYCFNPSSKKITPTILDALVANSTALLPNETTSFDGLVNSGTIRNTTSCKDFFYFQQCAAAFSSFAPSCINSTSTAQVRILFILTLVLHSSVYRLI
jgi:hypothetical protein